MPSARIPNALRVRAVLVSKSLKLIHRNTSIVSTFALTTIIIFTTLYLFYTVCDNYSYRMFSGPPIQHASIELECDRAASAAHCRPAHDDNSKDLTLTELLLSTAHKRKAPERGVEKLLSRIALSGVPLLDLTDFVLLADAVNAILGQEGRADLMSKAYLRERFSNLVLVRDKEIRVAPSNCFTAAFVEFMANASAATQGLKFKLFDDAESAACGDTVDTLAVLELQLSSACANDCRQGGSSDICATERPAVTIRMHPSAVPDTRNFLWSPLTNRVPSKTDAGQLLYFLSGFLTLQTEVQSFLALRLQGVARTATNVLAANSSALSPVLLAFEMATLLHSGSNVTSVVSVSRTTSSAAHVPVLIRAFPTREYTQNSFWSKFGLIISIALCVYISLPAGVVAGLYRTEIHAGIIDLLSTIPGVSKLQSMQAWAVASCICVVALSFPVAMFFACTLLHSSAWVAVLPIALCGLNMSVIALFLGEIVQSADTVTIAVPTIVFISLLPGAVYSDVTFDCNKSFVTEMLLCLLPPSAAALSLRQAFRIEALSIAADWNYPAHISRTPLYAYSVMLAITFALLNGLLILYAQFFKINSQMFRNCKMVPEEQEDLSEPHVLSASNVSKSYVRGQLVLSNVTTQFSRGEVSVLLGSNGSGKSTLLRILCGLDNKFEGRVQLKCRSSDDSVSSRRRIGWCPQNDALWDLLTVKEHVKVYAVLLGCDASASFAMLDRMDMTVKLGAFACALSGGMKRRLSLCLAFIGGPIFVCLDEATTGCDSSVRELVWEEILSQSTIFQSSVLVSTHHTDDIDILAQRILFLNDNYLVLDCPVDSFVNDRPILFSTWSSEVQEKFRVHFSDTDLLSSCCAVDSEGPATGAIKQVWSVAEKHQQLLQQFILSLSRDVIDTWELRHPSVFKMLLRLRYLEILARAHVVALVQVLVPFAVVYLMCFSCSEFPRIKLKISSDRVGGFGEVMGSVWNRNMSSNHNRTAIGLATQHPISWQQPLASTDLAKLLDSQYFAHSSQRFAAFVLLDFDSNWLSSSILVPVSGVGGSNGTLFEDVLAQQATACSGKSVSDTLCFVQIVLVRDGNRNSSAIQLLTEESVHADITLLLNVTSDHAAPIYLKELVRPLTNTSGRSVEYELFSHPLDVRSDTNIESAFRGYLGSNMILIFVIIVSVSTAKSIIQFNATGAKLQLHLAGVRCHTYWITNYVFDSLLLLCTFISIAAALFIGGPPISEVYIFSASTFLTCLVGFAFATTASSYAICCRSSEPLSGQLRVLFPAVVFGYFMEEFFRRIPNEQAWSQGLYLFFLYVWPCFTFSAWNFDMFTLYARHSLFLGGLVDSDFDSAELDSLLSRYMTIFAAQSAAYLAFVIIFDQIYDQVKLIFVRMLLRFRTSNEKLANPSIDGSSPVRTEEQSILFDAFTNTERVEDVTDTTCLETSNQLVIGSDLYAFRGLRKTALEDLCFHLTKGEKVALVGRNGGGKSTFFKMLSLSENCPTIGRLSIRGMETSTNKWNIWKSGALGYVPQQGGLLEFVSPRDALDLFSRLKGCGRAGAFKLIESRFERVRVAYLSGGNKKKLAVEIASLGEVPLLLLDEVTSGIDPVSTDGITRHLQRLSASTALIFSSHRIDESLRVCSRVIVLEEGRIVFDGSSAKFDACFASKLFQVDIYLDRAAVLSTVLSLLADAFYGELPSHRVYGGLVFRVTFKRDCVNLGALWHKLHALVTDSHAKYFSFRDVDSEELVKHFALSSFKQQRLMPSVAVV